jgi:hypothetical protein
MTLPNRIIIEKFLQVPAGDAAALPAEQLALLQEDIEENLRRAKTAKDRLDGALARKYGDRATAHRHQAGRDTGTIRLADGDVTVVADLPKRITWNQAQLGELVERIRASGEDPAEYASTEFKVSERTFTAWPESIRQLFAPARTVRTGKASFRLILGDEEATR